MYRSFRGYSFRIYFLSIVWSFVCSLLFWPFSKNAAPSAGRGRGRGGNLTLPAWKLAEMNRLPENKWNSNYGKEHFFASKRSEGGRWRQQRSRQPRSPSCFFVPGTNSKKWHYALSLESVLHDAKHGLVIIDGGRIKTVTLREIVRAADRIRDTSTVANKAWETPVY